MRRFYFLIIGTIALCAVSQHAMAQKTEFRQSQSRMIEPRQEVFVRPLVVDLNVTTEERQTKTWSFPDHDINSLTVDGLRNLKTNALYLTAQVFDADVIVAVTFDVRSIKKGLEITVSGFPAKYQNWQVAKTEEDYQWIKDIYGIYGVKNSQTLDALKER